LQPRAALELGLELLFWPFLISGTSSSPGLPEGSYPTNVQNVANSLTELDWAVRADTTFVAIVTPAFVPTPPQTGGFQYGCAAVNFDLLHGFGSLVATVDDVDGSSGISEQQGANGCTYEPKSNTGIVIGRHLLNTDLQEPSQYQIYSLLDTGVMP
jgi:hypothetical protein